MKYILKYIDMLRYFLIWRGWLLLIIVLISASVPPTGHAEADKSEQFLSDIERARKRYVDNIEMVFRDYCRELGQVLGDNVDEVRISILGAESEVAPPVGKTALNGKPMFLVLPYGTWYYIARSVTLKGDSATEAAILFGDVLSNAGRSSPFSHKAKYGIQMYFREEQILRTTFDPERLNFWMETQMGTDWVVTNSLPGIKFAEILEKIQKEK